MEFANVWLPVIFASLLALAGLMWYGNNRSLAIWVAVFAVITLVIAVGWYFQRKVWEAEAAASKGPVVDPARLAYEASQRANVVFDTFIQKPFVDVNGKVIYWQLTPQWIKKGPTAAKQCRIWSAYKVWHPNEPKEFSLFENRVDVPPIDYSAESPIQGKHINFMVSDFVRMVETGGNFFVGSMVSYTDIFGKTVEKAVCGRLVYDIASLANDSNAAPFRYGYSDCGPRNNYEK